MLIKIITVIIVLTVSIVNAQQQCSVREVERLQDQAFVVCKSGKIPITREQYSNIPVHELCTDGTGPTTAFIEVQYNTPSREPESCDVFDASNSDNTKHIKHIRLPNGNDIDINTNIHRPQRDIGNRLIGFNPPIPNVVITGNKQSSLLFKNLLKLILPKSLYAAVTFDQSQSTNTGTALVTDISYSATVANNTNRALYVGLCTANGTSDETTADTFNSVDMALLARTNSTTNDITNAYLFRLTNPTATTANVSFTLSTGRRASSGTISLHSVNQTTPDDTPQTTANNDDTSSVSVNVTTETGDMIVDVGCGRNSSLTFTMGSQTGRTQRWINVTTSTTTSNNIHGGGSTRTGTGSLAMDWTLSASNGMSMIATNVNQSSAAINRRPIGINLLR